MFLNKLMEYNATQQMMLQCTQANERVKSPVTIRHFTLHYVPGFTHDLQIQLLFDILQRIPLPFQLFHCTINTTAEEIELFFQRMTLFSDHKYIIFSTNQLSSDIQEVRTFTALL